MSKSKVKLDRREIHRGMARNPGGRKPKFLRLAQAADSKAFAKAMIEHSEPHQTHRDAPRPPIVRHGAVDPDKLIKGSKKPGFIKRMFQRKTGG